MRWWGGRSTHRKLVRLRSGCCASNIVVLNLRSESDARGYERCQVFAAQGKERCGSAIMDEVGKPGAVAVALARN
jgi:hypothetical protein